MFTEILCQIIIVSRSLPIILLHAV